MHSVDDLARIDPLETDRGDPAVRVPELALDDRQRDPFVRHLYRVSMPQLVRGEPPPDTGLRGEAAKLAAGSCGRPAPAACRAFRRACPRARHGAPRDNPDSDRASRTGSTVSLVCLPSAASRGSLDRIQRWTRQCRGRGSPRRARCAQRPGRQRKRGYQCPGGCNSRGDQIAGTGLIYPFELTVPGPAFLPVAGVTAVGVRRAWRALLFGRRALSLSINGMLWEL